MSETSNSNSLRGFDELPKRIRLCIIVTLSTDSIDHIRALLLVRIQELPNQRRFF
jgi:hypothetical protein